MESGYLDARVYISGAGDRQTAIVSRLLLAAVSLTLPKIWLRFERTSSMVLETCFAEHGILAKAATVSQQRLQWQA